MAIKISEVFEIELLNSYVKQPIKSMIIVKVNDISWFVKNILIPSLNKHTKAGVIVSQQIMYLESPNQCKKCPKNWAFWSHMHNHEIPNLGMSQSHKLCTCKKHCLMQWLNG
jgi:hypothetical protein